MRPKSCLCKQEEDDESRQENHDDDDAVCPFLGECQYLTGAVC